MIPNLIETLIYEIALRLFSCRAGKSPICSHAKVLSPYLFLEYDAMKRAWSQEHGLSLFHMDIRIFLLCVYA